MTPSLHHLALRTRDVAALAAFYRAVLDLSVARETPGYSVWLALDGAVLMVEMRDADEPSVAADTRELVAFRVTPEERDAVRTRLAARGVSLDGETAHTTYFRDPDGRRVAVSTYPL